MDSIEPITRPARFPPHQRSLNHLLPPTPTQCTALGDLHSSLLSSEDQSIFDWLEIVRSARNEIQQWKSTSPLTDKEFIAIAALSSADDENIREWFRKCNKSHDVNYKPNPVDPRYSTNSEDSSSRSSRASSRKFPRSSAYTTPRSSLHSFSSKTSSFPQIDSLPEEVKTVSGFDGSGSLQSYGKLEETPETAITSPGSGLLSKTYRCTTGEHLPKASSSTYNAFRRHELEHTVKYHCIPRNFVPIHDTGRGKQCVLCGELNPDRGHLMGHRIEPCLERDEPLRFTRQDLLAAHLKEKHMVPADRRKLLTRKWCYQLKKTAFSCGICVGVLFASKHDQLSHIQLEHSSDGMEHWSETTMMRNLLRHPEVNPAWQQILNQHPGVQERSLFWSQSANDNIHLELDLKSETAENFAATAFRTAESKSEMTHHDDTRFPLRLAVEKKTEISDPSLESPFLLKPQHYVNSSIIDNSVFTEFDSLNPKDSTCDTIMPPAEHTAPPRVADRLATIPTCSDTLQHHLVRTPSYEFQDEPKNDLLSEPLHRFIDPRQTLRTYRRGLYPLETSMGSVDMVAEGMNLLWEQTLHSPWTIVHDTNSESGVDNIASQGAPHARIEGSLHSRFSPYFPHKATTPRRRLAQ